VSLPCEHDDHTLPVSDISIRGRDKLLPNGTVASDYGDHPHGLAIFTPDGYYSLQIYRAQRLKFASGEKFSGTPEEYKDVSLSMSTSFGRYSIDAAKGYDRLSHRPVFRAQSR
jgi:hypothetical protein